MQVVPPLLVKVLPQELRRGFARLHLALSQGHATENYRAAQLFCIRLSLLLGGWIWEQQVRGRYLSLGDAARKELGATVGESKSS